jgi:hypothetical protein
VIASGAGAWAVTCACAPLDDANAPAAIAPDALNTSRLENRDVVIVFLRMPSSSPPARPRRPMHKPGKPGLRWGARAYTPNSLL